MQLTADDRQWVAEEIARQVRDQSENGAFRSWLNNGGFSEQATRWVISQAQSMSSQPSGWCDLGQAVALAVRQSMNDENTIRQVMDNIKAEERRIMQEATGGALGEQAEVNGEVGRATGPIDNGAEVVGLDGDDTRRYTFRIIQHRGPSIPTVVMELLGAVESLANENADLREELAQAVSETMREVDTPADSGMHLHAHPARP